MPSRTVVSNMSRTPPFRSRPQLHLAFTNLNGSPRHPSHDTPGSSGFSTPSATPLTAAFPTPFATTAYSPFRSAGLKPPTPYGGPMDFTPRRGDRPRFFDNYRLYRIRRLLSSKPLWFLLVLSALAFWWFHGGINELDLVKISASGFGKELFQDARTQDLQFFPATNPKIHVRLPFVNWKMLLLNRISTSVVGPLLQIDCARTGLSQVSTFGKPANDGLMFLLMFHLQVCILILQSETPRRFCCPSTMQPSRRRVP